MNQKHSHITLVFKIKDEHPVGWLEFNVPFQHKYGYIRDDEHPVSTVKSGL